MSTSYISFFFFNDTAPTEISPLPLHDALPIYKIAASVTLNPTTAAEARKAYLSLLQFAGAPEDIFKVRSEEHTSELQSQSNLVCRLLLEKKKKILSARPHEHHRVPDASQVCAC